MVVYALITMGWLGPTPEALSEQS